MKNFFIINKVAGAKLGEEIVKKQIAELSDEIKENNEFHLLITSRPKEATEMAKKLCEEYKTEEINVFACGGDGTCFEVVNGLVGHLNVHLGIVPVGSCNDFLKSYPDYDFMSIEKLLSGTYQTIDTIDVDGESVLNVANFGFDAKTNYDQLRYRSKFKTVKKAYNFSLLKNILSPKLGDKVTIMVDDKIVFDKKALLINVANGQYYGGGYKCSPYACTDDGILNFMAIKKVTPITFLMMVNKYKIGEHLTHKKFKKVITYVKGRNVKIISLNDLVGCLDGETRIRKEFNLHIVENSISLILPK